MLPPSKKPQVNHFHLLPRPTHSPHSHHPYLRRRPCQSPIASFPLLLLREPQSKTAIRIKNEQFLIRIPRLSMFHHNMVKLLLIIFDNINIYHVCKTTASFIIFYRDLYHCCHSFILRLYHTSTSLTSINE